MDATTATTSTSWLAQHWGEAAAFTLVALAFAHLVRKKLFRKKTGSSCCKTGCSTLSKPAHPPKSGPNQEPRLR